MQLVCIKTVSFYLLNSISIYIWWWFLTCYDKNWYNSQKHLVWSCVKIPEILFFRCIAHSICMTIIFLIFWQLFWFILIIFTKLEFLKGKEKIYTLLVLKCWNTIAYIVTFLKKFRHFCTIFLFFSGEVFHSILNISNGSSACLCLKINGFEFWIF